MHKIVTMFAMLLFAAGLGVLGWSSFAQGAPATSTPNQPNSAEYGQIRGRVFSGRTGQPLGNVQAAAINTEKAEVRFGTTDASGFYTISALLTGTYRIRFTINGIITGPVVHQDDAFGAQYYKQGNDAPQGELINLRPGARLVLEDTIIQTATQLLGVVRDAATQQPISGFLSIRLYTLAGQAVPPQSNETSLVSPDGRYALGNVPNGVYKLWVAGSASAYYPQSATFEDATPITLTTGVLLIDHDVYLQRPQSADLIAVATAKALPNTLLVVPGSKIAPLYSLDGGTTWHGLATTPWTEQGQPGISLVPTQNPQAPTRLLIAPLSKLYEYTSTIYYTDDYGQSYGKSYLSRLHDAHYAGCLTYNREPLFTSPVDPQRLYMVQTCIWGLEFLDYRLFTSMDRGINWQLICTDKGCASGSRYQPSPTHAARLYPLVEPFGMGRGIPAGGLLPDGSILHSDDHGQSWQSIPYTRAVLAADWSDNQRLYRVVDARTNFFDIVPYRGQRSLDDGATWVEWAHMPCPASFRQLVATFPADTVFLRCQHGLFRSRTGGDSWERLSTTPGEALTVDYGNPNRLLWSRNGELWASTDQGTTWRLLLSLRTLWLPLVRR